MRSLLFAFLIALFGLGNQAQTSEPIAVFEFQESQSKAGVVQGISSLGKPIGLVVSGKVKQSPHFVALNGKSKLLSKEPPQKLNRAIMRSGQVTLAVWMKPGNLNQAGPARIVTLSDGTSNRNLTLGQEKGQYQVRFRTTNTDNNGLPPLSSSRGSVTKSLTHVVFTRDSNGTMHLYLNGKRVSGGKKAGKLDNWNPNYRLAIGDETSGGRGWAGEIHQVAFFDRAISESEIKRSFQLGPTASLDFAASPVQLAAQHFQEKIAPLLSRHCLECHDIASAKGDLVLDRKASAMQTAIVPGNASESSLWTSVENDEMPHDRAPLLPEEKRLLKDWINSGAAWSLDWIDPADYQHSIGSTSGFVRRLTVQEYIRSVKVAVDVDIAKEALELLPPDVRADGFSNTAYNLSVDLEHIQSFNVLAKKIVDRIEIREFAKQYWGKARLTDNDMRGLIEKMGRWILRGPLQRHEVDLYRGVSTTVAATGGDYEAAVAATIAAMLQSPRFLYRIESQDDEGETRFIDDYELASRLSFLVWGSPPDQTLMNAASDAGLNDDAAVRKQVARMLDDPRAIDRSLDFVSQWLNLKHVRSLQPDRTRFPEWDSGLAVEMERETRAFFQHIVWDQRRPLSDLLDANVTFLTPRLATHYGLRPKGTGLQRYDLKEVPERGGLLTHGSVLTIGGDDASMVTRGLLVLNQLLRGVVNDPPPCVDTTPVPTSKGQSQRAIATERIENESCGGCHKRFEPLAFGLERYDGLGSYHETDEHGNDLRQDGELLVPGTAEPFQYKTSAMLVKMLSNHDRVRESLVWKLTQFAVGRPLTADDAAVVRQIHRRSQEAGGTYQQILQEIATSPLVRPGSQLGP